MFSIAASTVFDRSLICVMFVCILPQMLLNLHKKSWMDGLMLKDYNEHCKVNETTVKDMLVLAKTYNKVCM